MSGVPHSGLITNALFNIASAKVCTMKKILPLREIAEIAAGYPFRSRLVDMPDGTVRVIQMRDISTTGDIDWNSSVLILPEKNMEGYYLQPDDILFVMRGGKYYTARLQEIPNKSIFSMHFFRIRITQPQPVLPEFLAWQLEQMPAQRYYSSVEAGTDQKSLRIGDLEAMELTLPTLDRQHMLRRTVRSIKQNIATLKASIANSEKLLTAMALKEFEI